MADIDGAVRNAMDELYSDDPDTFMQRRTALAAAARKDGNTPAAKQISALRKPTRSVYAVNALARTDPDGVTELVELGEQLRQAERSVDAQQIRELTSHRRRLVNDLTRRAFEAIDDGSPSSAVRDEVVSTLTAALADPDVAARVADGTLVKPARWEGFGFGGSPDLTVVGGTDRGGSTAGGEGGARTPASQRPPSNPRTSTKGMSREEREESRRRADDQEAKRRAEEQAQQQAAAEEATRVRIAEAQQAVDDAEEAHLLASDEERSRVDRLRELEEQVADARKAVDEARIQLRRAEIRQRRTRDALERIGAGAAGVRGRGH